jgi:hypothetical protein
MKRKIVITVTILLVHIAISILIISYPVIVEADKAEKNIEKKISEIEKEVQDGYEQKKEYESPESIGKNKLYGRGLGPSIQHKEELPEFVYEKEYEVSIWKIVYLISGIVLIGLVSILWFNKGIK